MRNVVRRQLHLSIVVEKKNMVYSTKFCKVEKHNLIEHARAMLANCEIRKALFGGFECGRGCLLRQESSRLLLM